MGSTHREPGKASTQGRGGEYMKGESPVDRVDSGLSNTSVLEGSSAAKSRDNL